jgi:hypothetical protein
MTRLIAVAVAAVVGAAGLCHAEDIRPVPGPEFARPLLAWPDRAPAAPLANNLGMSFRTNSGELVRPNAGAAIAMPVRPTWAWPVGGFWWAVAPGSASVRRTWQAGWQPAVSETVRLASTTGLASTSGPTVPTWLRAMSTLTATDIALPPWPHVRLPDLRPPTEHRHVDIQEPPDRFVHWTDRVETVLSAGEVGRFCRFLAGKPPPAGKVYHGCAHRVAGRCLITRIDDPGVARHELAHCNGWKHPGP